MTSPGGIEVGRVSIRVLPDTSEFYARAKKDLEQIARKLKLNVEVNIDGTAAKAEIEKLKAQLDGKNVKMDVEVDGDGVTREVRRIRQLAQKLVGAIKMTVGINIPASLARIKADMIALNKVVRGYNIRVPIEVVGLSKWLAILTAVSGILLSIPHLIGAIGGAVAVVGGLFATLPALAVGAAVGISALVVGMQGFFSALSNVGDAAAFEESLKKLTPSAQEAARALATFKEPLSDIRKAVQEELFSGMSESFLELKALLPPIKSGLVGAAGGIRDMTKSWIKMATSQQSVADLKTIMDNNTQAFKNAKNSLAGFGAGLRDIAVVGSSFLPGFGIGVDKIAQKFADWAANARETGRMQEWIQNALDKMKQLGRIVSDVWHGFSNLFDALRGGEDFLDIIERGSQAFRDWSEAKDTQKTLQSLAKVMRVVIDAGVQLFGQVFRTAGAVFRDLEPFLITFAQTFGTVVAGAIRAITPLLQSMAKWFSENKEIMVPLVITIISMVTAFKLLATVSGGILKIADGFKAIKAASKLIGGIIADIGKFIFSLGKAIVQATIWSAKTIAQFVKVATAATVQAAKASATWIASAAKSASFTARYYGIMAAQAIKAWVKMAASAVANAVKIAAVWIAQTVRMVATTIAQMAIAVAAWVANWVRMAAVALAQAARIALAWLIAMGPIAIIIAAIVALVALIILNWDKIAAFLEMIWNWIKDLAATVWGAIVDFFTFIWDWMKSTAESVWTGIADFFSGIWNGIKDTAVNVWNAITAFLSSVWNGIKDVANSIINGIKDAWNGALDFIKSIPGRIWDAIKAGAGILFNIGKDIINGIVNGLKRAASAIWNFIKGICEDVWNSIKDFFGIGSPSKLMAQGGQWIMQGLVIGMEKESKNVLATSANVSKGIVDAFGSSMTLGQNIADGIMTGIPDAVSAVDKFTKATVGTAEQNLNADLGVDNIQPLADTIAESLNGVSVQMDSRPVGKLINKRNVLDRRRG